MPNRTTITIEKNGPYLVSGSAPLSVVTIESNTEGDSINWGEGNELPASGEYELCRCGKSRSKPFCDGMHASEPKFQAKSL